ncbi:MAG TPA: tetratricopeptide repeat protein, partial [Bacteroidales bacterium]|nr:tetratricopeptide repeat protein [Bacteroidales bacterium]
MRTGHRYIVFLLVFVVLLVPAVSFCDTPAKVDSLKKQLVHANDAEKLSLYIELIKSIRNIAPAEGINFAKEALALPETQKSEVLKAKLLNEQGVCYRNLNIPEKALKLHFEALQIFEKRFDSTGMAYTLADIGSVYHSLNDYENALDFHFKSLFLKEYLHDEPQIAYSQNAIGMVHSDMKDYRRALDFFISAMAIRKKYDQKLELANIYS